ncbi:MAG: substrate-binding domain-containing protein [Caldimonas sp.]
MLRRRPFLAAAAWLATTGRAAAERTPESATPLRCAADRSLVASGLARALQRGFAAYTGIRVLIVPGPALAILEAMRNGEADTALCNAPAAEEALEQQGLVHDRRLVAAGDFVIVGPVAPGRARWFPRGVGAVEALTHLHALASADPATPPFVSANDGSGVHVAEQNLWRQARLEPVAPWYVAADPGRDFLAQVRERRGWALVERSAWLAHGAGQAIAIQDDPQLAETVHVMRSFHATHPAGRIFADWVGGGRGRAVARAQRGYRAPRHST